MGHTKTLTLTLTSTLIPTLAPTLTPDLTSTLTLPPRPTRWAKGKLELFSKEADAPSSEEAELELKTFLNYGRTEKPKTNGDLLQLQAPAPYLPPATYHRPPATYHLPPTTYHLPPATYHLPPATDHLPPTTHHLPPATCHLLLPTNCLLGAGLLAGDATLGPGATVQPARPHRTARDDGDVEQSHREGDRVRGQAQGAPQGTQEGAHSSSS